MRKRRREMERKTISGGMDVGVDRTGDGERKLLGWMAVWDECSEVWDSMGKGR